MYSNIAIYYCVSQTSIVHPSVVRYIMICIDVFVKGAGEYGYDISSEIVGKSVRFRSTADPSSMILEQLQR